MPWLGYIKVEPTYNNNHNIHTDECNNELSSQNAIKQECGGGGGGGLW